MTPAEIVELRRAMKLTQHQLGQLVGAHGVTVCQWEKGNRRPSPWREGLMVQIRRAHEISPEIARDTAYNMVARGVYVALATLLVVANPEAA